MKKKQVDWKGIAESRERIINKLEKDLLDAAKLLEQAILILVGERR